MKNFCALRVLADCLQVDLKAGETFRNPGGVSEKLAQTQAWAIIAVHFGCGSGSI